jgi:hypothetical protein
VKHTFSLVYEIDTTVPVAVAVYLDAEHYVFLHSKYGPKWQVLRVDGHKVVCKQTVRHGWLRTGQLCTAEWVPPARFLNYGIRPSPWWIPSIHHVMRTRTDLCYYPNESGTATVSQLDVELDLPFFLWPLRHAIERKICKLKREKDDEDIALIERRARIFGRDNIRSYLADHQFMLHKEDFVKHFGGDAAEAAPLPDSARV